MAKPQRPGLQPVTQLDQKVRTVLEPITDLMARMTGTSLPPLPDTALFTEPFLTGSATLVDVINRVNFLHFNLNLAIASLNATKARLQED